MEYEAYEPDPNDEYYGQMCSAAYATMFNEGSAVYEDSYSCDQEHVYYPAAS